MAEDGQRDATALDWRDVVRERAELFGMPMPTEYEMSTWAGIWVICERQDCHAVYHVPAFMEAQFDRYAISNGWRRRGTFGQFWYCPTHASLDANKG